MIQKMRISAFALVMPLLCVLMSSCRKDLCYDYSTKKTVEINVTWPKSITVPEGVTAVFYPVDGSTPYTYNIPALGGSVVVPLGAYTVVIFNNDTEYVMQRNTENVSTIESYTGILQKSGVSKGFPEQDVVNMPDMFYSYVAANYQVKSDVDLLPINATPQSRVIVFKVRVHVTGLKNVSSAGGLISGISGSYFPGTDIFSGTSSAVAFDFGKENSEYIQATVRVFGLSRITPQENKFRLALKLINNEVKYYYFDITDQMINLKNDVVVNIQNTIVVDDVNSGSGSGFNADVNDWSNSDVPLK